MNLYAALTLISERPDVSKATVMRYRYEVNIWNRFSSISSTDLRETDLDDFRIHAGKKLATRTIESVISSMRQLCKLAGTPIGAGRKLRVKPRQKNTPAFSEFCRVIDAASWYAGKRREWWIRWLCWAYITGLRRSDLLKIQPEMISDGKLILWAKKTGKKQIIPLPKLLPIGGKDFLKAGTKQIRFALNSFCRTAGVQQITPQAIRRLSAREWERARAGCGAVILGHSIPGWSAATESYLDRSESLENALRFLRVPDILKSSENDAGTIADAFSGLNQSEREIALKIISAIKS